ncbi:hypothetical protein HMPREF1870_01771 [Bacteroidales bacterium KA00344]|nr:hypothetical protein HMPREF1870_01771 [Bacteroidales bacterium KA00344]
MFESSFNKCFNHQTVKKRFESFTARFPLKFEKAFCKFGRCSLIIW